MNADEIPADAGPEERLKSLSAPAKGNLERACAKLMK